MAKYETVWPKASGELTTVTLDGEVIATFLHSTDANDYVRIKTDPADFGKQLARADYWSDVRSIADSIKDELSRRIKDGERGETLREWLIEHIRETIDGSQRVIYTAQAQECLLYSEHDGQYLEDFGSDGAVSDGAINWSALAFSAFEADVIEQLGALGVDLNAPEDSTGIEEETAQ
jgi:hypothetical protein